MEQDGKASVISQTISMGTKKNGFTEKYSQDKCARMEIWEMSGLKFKFKRNLKESSICFVLISTQYIQYIQLMQ